MCALFGYLDCGKKIPHKILQKLVQALANASEERGDHASGNAYKTGGNLTIFKRPRPAHRMKFRIPKGTTAVMGHTRFTTQGDQKKNYNNHPFCGYFGVTLEEVQRLIDLGFSYDEIEMMLWEPEAVEEELAMAGV